MGPDFHLAHGGAGKGKNLEGKHNSFEKKVVTATATQDDHPIRGIAVGTILEHLLAGVSEKACIWTVQRKNRAELNIYSQSPRVLFGVDDNTSPLLRIFALSPACHGPLEAAKRNDRIKRCRSFGRHHSEEQADQAGKANREQHHGRTNGRRQRSHNGHESDRTHAQ